MSLRAQDDKLLGEKVEYYCSSSEEEEDECDDVVEGSEDEDEDTGEAVEEEIRRPELPPALREHNTGPKGVIEDWKTFKRNEQVTL